MPQLLGCFRDEAHLVAVVAVGGRRSQQPELIPTQDALRRPVAHRILLHIVHPFHETTTTKTRSNVSKTSISSGSYKQTIRNKQIAPGSSLCVERIGRTDIFELSNCLCSVVTLARVSTVRFVLCRNSEPLISRTLGPYRR